MMIRASRGIVTVFIFIVASFVSFAGVAQAQTTILNSVHDTYLQKDTANKNQGIVRGSVCNKMATIGHSRVLTKPSLKRSRGVLNLMFKTRQFKRQMVLLTYGAGYEQTS